MKRFAIIFALCLCLVGVLPGCGAKPIYTPEVIPTFSGIADTVQVQLADDTGKVWLDNSHFASVEVKTGQDGISYLEFVTTEAGKALLADATAANLNKPLTLVADNKFLFSPVVMAPIEDGVFVVANNKTYDAQYIFNLLTDAEDLMQGVRPPSYVLPVDEVKGIAYEKAGITADQVLDVTCSLTFDKDWRGWEYRVEFLVKNVRHVCEINAVSGTIIKYTG